MGRFEDVPGCERDTTLRLSGIGCEAYEDDFMPQILTANYLWEMGHDKIVCAYIPREEKTAGMRWITLGVMFLKFRTQVDAETFMNRVHGVEIASGDSHSGRYRDLRVTWAREDMDTFERERQLHPKKPRYFDNVWKFLPRHIQDVGIDSP